jgi:uncharacterized repeat protein (TIGR03803 family)
MRYTKHSQVRIASLVPLIVFFAAFAALATNAAAAVQGKTIDAFKTTNGASPNAGLILDSQGNLYGTTPGGGAYGYGVVYELSPTSAGWAETVLYNFCEDTCPQGSSPQSALTFDSDGNLYGTTAGGGRYASGTVFELSPSPSGWIESVLYSFCTAVNCADGAHPTASVIFDEQGRLYGTTLDGGQTSCNGFGCGVVFELKRDNSGRWSETVLYTFTGGDDGGSPIAGLVSDSSGDLYGTTWMGGAQSSGVAFELTSVSGLWSESVLHTFCSAASCSDGSNPWAGLILGPDGSLYGTTISGGKTSLAAASGYGVVFQLTPTAGVWNESVLHAFDGADGRDPYAGVILDSLGNLYGTTALGGDYSCNSVYGCGLVFELTPTSNGGWDETALLVFSGGNEGLSPYANLVMNPQGELYGTTEYAGERGLGTVFELE